MKYIDLTHNFSANMPVYPGDEASELIPLNKDGVFDHRLASGMHVGTHMDAPAHMLESGKLISDYPAEKFFGKGVLIDARGSEKIDVDLLDNLSPALPLKGEGGKQARGYRQSLIFIVMTGWSHKFGEDDYFKNYPVLTENFANKLVELGVSIIGMDTPSPDAAPYEIHKILLSNDILIIENLTNLTALASLQNFEITALPLKMESNASFCRVVAKLE